ncbi:PepSY domain-containing protein [Streptomyces longispororuber]|uniref:PepSY domain-containing protein n=1 Tax=Streptomyces longispororuber TaxID=68230 RepID=UPI0036FC146C
MKRNIVIATVAVATLVGGGTATAFALGGDGETSAAGRSSVQLKGDDRHDERDDVTDDRHDDERDDRNDDVKDDRRDDARDDRDDRHDSDDRDDRDDRDEDARDAAAARAAKVSAADAVAAALRSASGTAVSAELDDEDGGLVWDVDVLGKGDTWYSVEIDPGTGKVLGTHTERDAEDTAEARAALKGATVTAAEAAKAVAGKGRVTSVDLDDDRSGKGVWEVETVSGKGAESHWNVDLGSGRVASGPADD